MGAYRLPTGAHDLSFPLLELPGVEQRAQLRLFASRESRCGKVSYVASVPGVATVEDLPYAVTFARLSEDARRLPLALSRR